MAIARSFRQGWLTSARVDALRDDGAELFLFRLGLAADKNGVFFGDPEMLRSAVYPLQTSRRRLADVARFRDKLAMAGLVRLWNAEDGRCYVQILRWRQKTPNEKRVHPLPPGEPDDTGQEVLPLAGNGTLRQAQGIPPLGGNGIEENSPQSPPQAGGGDASLSRPKPRRGRRLPRLETLRDELAEINREIGDIERPGGCAHRVEPQGEKRVRWEALFKRRSQVELILAKVRAELAAA